MNDIMYDALPAHIRSAVKAYIEEGRPLGHFLSGVVANNLLSATAHADVINYKRLAEITRWWYNEAPMECWGSPEAMARWITKGGLRGIKQEV